MEKRAVVECMSKAIVEVADKEYPLLSLWMRDIDIAERINGALESFAKLRSGAMPKYDEWATLLYITWYHANHVNLAYSMIEAALVERERLNGGAPSNPTLTKTGRLHVVDFGCGTLAMQFGVALAVAAALDRGEKIYSVKVDSLDASQEMIALGQKLWDSFTMFVAQDGRLDSLARVLDRMDVRVGEFIPSTDDHEYWLSAMHVTYGENVNDVKRHLRNLCNQVRPSLGFMTSHDDPRSKTLAEMASPFKDDPQYAYLEPHSGISRKFAGELVEVTNWRQEVKRNICQTLLDDVRQFRYIGGDRGHYMDGRVSWGWQPAMCRISARNEDDLPW